MSLKAAIMSIISVVSFQWAPAAWAQDSSFVVLSGISEGPAQIFLDGKYVGKLSSEEVTISVVAGIHTIAVLTPGFQNFTKRLSIAPADVQLVQVVLQPARASVIQDKPERATVAQGSGHYRLIHLEPAQVAIEIDGQVVGRTPANVSIPAGDVRVSVGAFSSCWHVSPGDSGYVRIRSGSLEVHKGVRPCDDRDIPLVFRSLPRDAEVFVDDSPLILAWAPDSSTATGAAPAGLHVLAFKGPYMPSDLDLELVTGDSVLILVSLGPRKPANLDEILAQPVPTRESVLLSPPEHIPAVDPDTVALVRNRRNQCFLDNGQFAPACQPDVTRLAEIQSRAPARQRYVRDSLRVDSLNRVYAPIEDSVRLQHEAALSRWQSSVATATSAMRRWEAEASRRAGSIVRRFRRRPPSF